jgi:hypothetical protein
MISTPITVAMMILPSQFDEALRIPRSMAVQLVGRREPGHAEGNEIPTSASPN